MKRSDKSIIMTVPPDWLVGGGDMGELIRSMDWSSTPLGPIPDWPYPLQVITNIALFSTFAMVIFWGKELIHIYNDAYRAIVADKHAHAMGRSAREIWPEAWEFNRPIFEKVMQEGQSVHLKDQLFRIKRCAEIEDAFFTVSYSPIWLDQGCVGGTLVTLIETTERLRVEKHMQESDEQYRALLKASSDIIFSMSPDWKKMLYFRGRDFIADTENPDLSWPDKYILPDDKPHVMSVINEAIRTKDVFELEHRVRRVDGTIGWTFSRAIPLLDTQGEIRVWFGMASDITDRKAMANQLQAERQRLFDMFEFLPVMACLITQDYRMDYANGLFREKFGEANGRRCYEYCFGKKERCDFCESFKVLETRKPHHWGCYHPGTSSFMDVYDFPFIESNGSLKILKVNIDITERKLIEQQLERDLDAMTRLQKLGTLSVQEGNLEPVLTAIVDAAIAISGADFGNVQILDPASGDLRIAAQRCFPEWWIKFWNSVNKDMGVCGTAMEHGTRVIVEDVEQSPIFLNKPSLDIQRKAGVRAVQSTPLISRSGKTMGMFSTHSRTPGRPDDRALCLLDLLACQTADIIEHAQNQVALRESEERMHLAFQATQDGIWDWNLETDEVFYSSRWKTMLGYEESEIEPHISALKRLLHPDDLPRANRVEQDVLNGKRDYLMEFRMRHKDGRYVDILSHGFPIRRKPDGPIVRIVGTHVDMTERKALENRLQQLNAELNNRVRERTAQLTASSKNLKAEIVGHKRTEEERQNLQDQLLQAQKLESIGQLAGGVAHDLNNLLTPILGYSEMLLEGAAADDPARESLKEIVGAGLRARNLVHQLLAFSRKQVLEYQQTDLNRIVDGIESLLRRTISEDIRFEVTLSPADLPVMVDTGQIEQVIMNLAVNAADAMPGGGTLNIETAAIHLDEAYAEAHTLVEPGDYALLTVSDTGHGMDEKTLARVFEPFFSTKGMGGTGLGLATVYGIVKQQGGYIWVYSEPGKGATFKVYLPLIKTKMPHPENIIGSTTADLSGTETILLVEDNEQVRNLSLAILRRQGYVVITAENGQDALAVLLRHERPLHLLLTDVVMPGMNGMELFAKAAEKYQDLKVLFMSGYNDNMIAHHGVLDRAVAFIQKPFTVKALAAKVREVLDQE